MRRARWGMIALVFFATMINYLDRQTLSVAAPVLREQFHMTNVEYSRVVFAFMLAYTIMNGISGPLVDRIGTRLGYTLCMTWWSLAAILHVFQELRIDLTLAKIRMAKNLAMQGNRGFHSFEHKHVESPIHPPDRFIACRTVNDEFCDQ